MGFLYIISTNASIEKCKITICKLGDSGSFRRWQRTCELGLAVMSSQGRQTWRGASPAFGISTSIGAHRDHSTKFHWPRWSETFFKKVITVVRVANTASRRTKGIRELNNIIIAHLANHHPSILNDKWRHDISQDWHLIATEYQN